MSSKFCGSLEHALSRRSFPGMAATAGAAAIGADMTRLEAMAAPIAADLKKRGKRVILLWLAGGSSQLESWDPKPGTATGGPFRAIPTSVPGLHISELLPKTAQVMHHLALVRCINTHEDDHGKGDYIMSTGRRKTPAQDDPCLGAVVAKSLDADGGSALPLHIVISPGGRCRLNADSTYLRPQYSSVARCGG